MGVLSGFPRSRLPDYDNDLMFGVLSGELAGLGSMSFIAPQNSPIHRIHPSPHIPATFFEPRVFCNIDQNAAIE